MQLIKTPAEAIQRCCVLVLKESGVFEPAENIKRKIRKFLDQINAPNIQSEIGKNNRLTKI